MSNSILDTLAARLSTPYAMFLGLGLASSATFTIGMASSNHMGLIPLVADSLLNKPGNAQLGTDGALRAFAWLLPRAFKWFPTSAILATLGFGAAAYTFQPSSRRPNVRPLLVGAVVGMIGINVYSKFLMFPINDKLVAESTARIASDSEIAGLIDTWVKRNVPRFLMSCASLALGTVAMLVS
ncbi:hypothetical protein BCV70DRAFT_201490 [Testicularia cyperi]|uniref:DUF1772-domain-containing protein n=1 Tax=Testicularia cyperi TaxID=1882483 RepID=A0A317XLL5_9BASI|nr:hypothetical protein BCV70DRAFT_201490 [Testicularia cyperi]